MKNHVTLTIKNLSKSYIAKAVFENISFSITGNKRVGLIGPNGAGKSTLFKILTKQLAPDQGHIVSNGTIGYLPQEIHFADSLTIKSFLKNFVEPREDYKIEEVLATIGMQNVNTKILVNKLSGGQQRKIAFAKLLLQEKTILLLDEPTNHLDLETKQWLISFLKSFEGIILTISHDRSFLNEICNQIMELNHGTLEMYDGNYEDYKIQKEERIQKAEVDFVVWQKRKKKMETRLALMRQRASVQPNPALGRLIRSREKMFEREILSKEAKKPNKEHNPIVSLAGGSHQGKMILKTNNLEIKKPESDEILIKSTTLEIRGSDRITLFGTNGTGKTTLLKTLINNYPNSNTPCINRGPAITVCYVDQKQADLDPKKTVLDEFTAKAKGNYRLDQYAKSVLHQFGLGQELYHQKVEQLSYGQKVRLRFAQISVQSYDLIILDEPTNHLDIPTREVIEAALQDYEGALLVVSHDEYFLEQIMINKIWEIKDKKLYLQ